MNYESLSMYQGNYIPSTVHATNDATTRFFERELFQRSISRFDFVFPETWDKNFVEFILWFTGFGAVFNTEKYGIVFQPCSFNGMLNIWYKPTQANVHTPLINENGMVIGEDCEILRINPDYFGVWDIIHYYAEQLSLLSQSLSMNIINTKLAYFIACEDKADAETLKKVLDKANQGEPNVFYKAKKRKTLEEKSEGFEEYTRDISNTYIADKIILAFKDVLTLFNNEVGIPNINTEKKERLISDEVNQNNIETLSRARIWRDTLQMTMDKCNALFGLNMSVKFHDFREDGDINATSEINIDRTI